MGGHNEADGTYPNSSLLQLLASTHRRAFEFLCGGDFNESCEGKS